MRIEIKDLFIKISLVTDGQNIKMGHFKEFNSDYLAYSVVLQPETARMLAANLIAFSKEVEKKK